METGDDHLHRTEDDDDGLRDAVPRQEELKLPYQLEGDLQEQHHVHRVVGDIDVTIRGESLQRQDDGIDGDHDVDHHGSQFVIDHPMHELIGPEHHVTQAATFVTRIRIVQGSEQLIRTLVPLRERHHFIATPHILLQYTLIHVVHPELHVLMLVVVYFFGFLLLDWGVDQCLQVIVQLLLARYQDTIHWDFHLLTEFVAWLGLA